MVRGAQKHRTRNALRKSGTSPGVQGEPSIAKAERKKSSIAKAPTKGAGRGKAAARGAEVDIAKVGDFILKKIPSAGLCLFRLDEAVRPPRLCMHSSFIPFM